MSEDIENKLHLYILVGEQSMMGGVCIRSLIGVSLAILVSCGDKGKDVKDDNPTGTTGDRPPAASSGPIPVSASATFQIEKIAGIFLGIVTNNSPDCGQVAEPSTLKPYGSFYLSRDDAFEDRVVICLGEFASQKESYESFTISKRAEVYLALMISSDSQGVRDYNIVKIDNSPYEFVSDCETSRSSELNHRASCDHEVDKYEPNAVKQLETTGKLGTYSDAQINSLSDLQSVTFSNYSDEPLFSVPLTKLLEIGGVAEAVKGTFPNLAPIALNIDTTLSECSQAGSKNILVGSSGLKYCSESLERVSFSFTVTGARRYVSALQVPDESGANIALLILIELSADRVYTRCKSYSSNTYVSDDSEDYSTASELSEFKIHREACRHLIELDSFENPSALRVYAMGLGESLLLLPLTAL